MKVEKPAHVKAFEAWMRNKKNFTATAEATNLSETVLRRWSQEYSWAEKSALVQAQNSGGREGGGEGSSSLASPSASPSLQLVSSPPLAKEGQGELSEEERLLKSAKQQLSIADALLIKGQEFIKNQGLENSRDALSAIKLGIEIQQRVIQIPDFLKKIIEGSDEQLLRRAQQLIEEVAAAQGEAEAKEEESKEKEEIKNGTIDEITNPLSPQDAESPASA